VTLRQGSFRETVTETGISRPLAAKGTRSGGAENFKDADIALSKTKKRDTQLYMRPTK